MSMAHGAAEFYTANLRYSDGMPVECVIADRCIGGVAEAAMADDKFSRENVGAVLSVTPCWCYGCETIDMNPLIPKAIWGFNGTERPGAVYLASALAGHNQKGLPAFGIYSREVQDMGDPVIPKDVQEKLLRFGRAALAMAQMRGKSYLAIGSCSMGIAGSMVNPDFFQDYLGMRNEFVESVEVERRVRQGIYDHEEFTRALEWTKKHCKEGQDYNPEHLVYSRTEKDAIWEYVVKMTMIIRDLMIGNPKLEHMGFQEEAMGHNAIAGGFQGQRQWTDFMPNGDFSEAILNSSFDWDGPRRPYTLATENDSLNAVTMLWGTLLTGTAQMFCDVRAYWSPEALAKTAGQVPEGAAANGFIYLTNSGAAALDGSMASDVDGHPGIKPAWEMTETDISRCLDATRWGAGKLATFRGGGFSSSFLSKGGVPLTMIRLNLLKGLGPVLQFAEGESVELPDNVEQAVIRRTDPTWPKTFFVPRLTGQDAFSNVYSVMENWGSNHCTLCYGHIGAQLMTLASMLRIPVCMHNLPDESIFRPAAWRMYGTHEAMSADFRACATYGPLYGPYPVRR